MTPNEYIEHHNVKPLSEAEIAKGKEQLRIYNSDAPMPWEEIYTRIATGMDMEDIAELYGHARKVALWAVKDNIAFTPALQETLEGEIDQRRKMHALEESNPVVAATLHQMANEYAPDAAKNIATFANKLVERAITDLDRPKRTTLDLVNLSKAVQTASDILGHTERHANASQTTNNTIQTGGWVFDLDTPKDSLPIIEGEVYDPTSTEAI